MKSVGARFLIPFGLLAVIITLLLFYQAYEANRKHANELISGQAAMALEFNLAIREYVAEQIRPVMESLVESDVFMPETMSTSFISRSIFEAVRKKFPNCIIRFSSDNPRNPINTANQDERRMIEYFRRNPRAERRVEEIQIDGKRYLAHFSPKWLKEECMRCHGDPADAPADLIRRYGTTASFYRKVGDVAGLDTVAVPVEAMNAALASQMRSHSITLAVGLGLLFGSIFLVFRFVVTRRLAAMAKHFNEIAAHAESPWMTPVEVKGNDEISVVGTAFNKLVEQLRSTHASLEMRVDQRTEELRKANEQLERELAERKRAEEALEESRRQLADIINFLPDATFVIDREGKVIAWNLAMERLTGVEASQILGRGNYEYSLPFYGERRPILIDLVFQPGGDVDALYVKAGRNESVLIGDAHISAPGWDDRYLSATAGALRDSEGNIVGAVEIIRDVTGRKRAEAMLDVSEKRFSVFMDHLPACVFIKDGSGALLFANRYLREIFGWEGALGKKTEELLPPNLAERMTAHDRKALEEGPITIQESIVDINGATRIFDTRKFPISAEGGAALLGGISVEVTERNRAMEALRQKTEELDRFFDVSLDMLCISDGDGRFKRLNYAWVKTLGYALDELLAMQIGDFVHPDDLEVTLETVAEATRRDVTDFINRFRCKDGTYRWIEWKSAPAGDFTYAAARDITERRRAQEEKEKLETRLRHAQKMEAIGTLAGGIAHDFNNILGVIIGSAEMALTEVPEIGAAHEFMQRVLGAGHRAKELVKQILTFSRMQAPEKTELVEIAGAIDDSLNFLRASLPSTVEIRRNIEPGVKTALVDATEIHRILVNLCANGAQAMEESGGTLEVDLGETTVDSETVGAPDTLGPGNYLRLKVVDSGRGMDSAILDRIFDPYFTTKEVGKGSGLGLAVVHGIVKRRRGAIDVRSALGKGTTVVVYLPKITGEASAPPVEDAPIPKGKERILFIDDEKVLAELGQKMLERLGYSVVMKTGGIEAMEAFKAQRDRFDLVITDYTMPQMNGADLARKMLRYRPDIPIILCTGYTERITEEKAREMGIRAFIQKPLNMRDMAEVVRKVLKDRDDT